MTAARVVVGGEPVVDVVVAALAGGARGYLFRSDPGPPAQPANRPFVGRTEPVSVVGAGGHTALDVRQIAVLAHLSNGRTDAEIAEAMGVPVGAVADVIGGIGSTLGTQDRAHMVVLALRSGAVR